MNYRKILIVDDSATARMILKRCCEIAGFHDSRYYEAEDGLQALSTLKEKDIDLVLTDLKMPKMDGNTFIKKLKLLEEGKDIPVVVISSIGSEVVESQLLEAGAKAVVTKPISPEKILEALED